MEAGAACRRRYGLLVLRTFRWTLEVVWTRLIVAAAEVRLNDHGRHGIGRIFGDWPGRRLARPAAIVGGSRRRQHPVRRRIDFEAPVTRLLAVLGEVARHVIRRRQ